MPACKDRRSTLSGHDWFRRQHSREIWQIRGGILLQTFCLDLWHMIFQLFDMTTQKFLMPLTSPSSYLPFLENLLCSVGEIIFPSIVAATALDQTSVTGEQAESYAGNIWTFRRVIIIWREKGSAESESHFEEGDVAANCDDAFAFCFSKLNEVQFCSQFTSNEEIPWW